MILKRLVEYSQQCGLPPRLYAPTRIHWLIELDEQGVPQGMVKISEQNGKHIGEERFAPALGNLRTSDIRPLLFCDNGGYVLRRVAKGKQDERVKEQHEAFKALVARCHAKLQLTETRAVNEFYQRYFDQLKIPNDHDPAHNITFRVQGQWVIDLPEVQQFWAEHASKAYNLVGAPALCLVCGEVKPAVRRHYRPVKGIPGGQPTGMALVSANIEACESYELEEGELAPICLDCSEQMLHALNRLLQDERTHLTIGPVAYCFWTRDPSDFDVTRFLNQPDPNDVKALMKNVTHGVVASSVDENEFYALALSANGARVVVRGYLELTVPEVQRHLSRWFEWQSLRTDDTPVGVFALARALYRDSKDIPAHVPETLIRCALTGAPLPMYLLQLALQRNRADQEVTENRARLIQAVLRSHNLL